MHLRRDFKGASTDKRRSDDGVADFPEVHKIQA